MVAGGFNTRLWNIGEGTGKYTSSGKLESGVVADIVKALTTKYNHSFSFKTHGGGYQRAGIPDLYFATKGVSVWIEVKRPGGDTTKLQHKTMQKLSVAGVYCGAVTSPEEALQLVEEAINDSRRVYKGDGDRQKAVGSTYIRGLETSESGEAEESGQGL